MVFFFGILDPNTRRPEPSANQPRKIPFFGTRPDATRQSTPTEDRDEPRPRLADLDLQDILLIR
jgi:hypothetical protein